VHGVGMEIQEESLFIPMKSPISSPINRKKSIEMRQSRIKQ